MQKDIIRILIIVGAILLIPLLGNLFVDGWNWSFFDFIVMGALLFCTGLAISFAIRNISDPIYRVSTVIFIVLALVALWTELAVGAVSQLVYFLLG